MWMRTQRQTVTAVRVLHEAQLFETLRTLMLPDKCYHESIDEQFEDPATYESRGPCGDNCLFCLRVQFSGLVSKDHLIAAFTANIFDKGAVRADKLVTLLTDKAHSNAIKKSVWGKNYSKVEPGHIHGLVLMLISADLLSLRLSSKSLIGNKKIQTKNVEIYLTKHEVMDDNGSYSTLSINDSDKWNAFHLIK